MPKWIEINNKLINTKDMVSIKRLGKIIYIESRNVISVTGISLQNSNTEECLFNTRKEAKHKYKEICKILCE